MGRRLIRGVFIRSGMRWVRRKTENLRSISFALRNKPILPDFASKAGKLW